MINLEKIPMRTQRPDVRNKNFEEVELGYNDEEAVKEASRCLNCKIPRCVQGCPINIKIPEFISAIKEQDIEKAYKIISESSSLSAICGRVCPQESQCEGKCVLGIKGEPIALFNLKEEDMPLSDTINGYWKNFIKIGNPNKDGFPIWEKFNDYNKLIIFNNKITNKIYRMLKRYPS